MASAKKQIKQEEEQAISGPYPVRSSRAAVPKGTRPVRNLVSNGASATSNGTYISAVGRRKTAIALVRLYEKGLEGFLVNEKTLERYFPDSFTRGLCQAPLNAVEGGSHFGVSARVRGGGVEAQAEAIRHGVARALVAWNPELKALLKKAGYLKRDPRMRERKKFGLRRARRARQWRKR